VAVAEVAVAAPVGAAVPPAVVAGQEVVAAAPVAAVMETAVAALDAVSAEVAVVPAAVVASSLSHAGPAALRDQESRLGQRGLDRSNNHS